MSELGSLLADTVTRLFTDLVTKELIESSEKGVWPDKLWRALEEGGLTLPLVAGALLSRAGLEVPFGPLTLAPVHRNEQLALSRNGGGWRVSGTATRVPW